MGRKTKKSGFKSMQQQNIFLFSKATWLDHLPFIVQ
jgi:hypothetical protein